MTTPFELVIDELDRRDLLTTDGRLIGRAQVMARCPAHDDRDPSLSVREADDGRCLVHCFAGCPTEEVIGAVGLKWSDLFEPDPKSTERTEDRHEMALECGLERSVGRRTMDRTMTERARRSWRMSPACSTATTSSWASLGWSESATSPA
jgi:hypothetical protein